MGKKFRNLRNPDLAQLNAHEEDQHQVDVRQYFSYIIVKVLSIVILENNGIFCDFSFLVEMKAIDTMKVSVKKYKLMKLPTATQQESRRKIIHKNYAYFSPLFIGLSNLLSEKYSTYRLMIKVMSNFSMKRKAVRGRHTWSFRNADSKV